MTERQILNRPSQICKCKNVANLKKHITRGHRAIKLQMKMQLTDRSELKLLVQSRFKEGPQGRDSFLQCHSVTILAPNHYHVINATQGNSEHTLSTFEEHSVSTHSLTHSTNALAPLEFTLVGRTAIVSKFEFNVIFMQKSHQDVAIFTCWLVSQRKHNGQISVMLFILSH